MDGRGLQEYKGVLQVHELGSKNKTGLLLSSKFDYTSCLQAFYNTTCDKYASMYEYIYQMDIYIHASISVWS